MDALVFADPELWLCWRPCNLRRWSPSLSWVAPLAALLEQTAGLSFLGATILHSILVSEIKADGWCFPFCLSAQGTLQKGQAGTWLKAWAWKGCTILVSSLQWSWQVQSSREGLNHLELRAQWTLPFHPPLPSHHVYNLPLLSVYGDPITLLITLSEILVERLWLIMAVCTQDRDDCAPHCPA